MAERKENLLDTSALKNGYGFDWSKVSAEENIIASYESVNGDNEKLRAIISKLIYALN